MTRQDYYNSLYSSYTKATVNRKFKMVFFENKNGWHETAELDADLALWILLNKKLEVVYE